MQRGDAFGGVAVQDHRISMLHIQRFDFFFGEFWHTCTKKQRSSFFIGTFRNVAFCFPLDTVLIKYLPLQHPLHSLPLTSILISTEAQSNDDFYSGWEIPEFWDTQNRNPFIHQVLGASHPNPGTEWGCLTLVCVVLCFAWPLL